MTEVAVIANVTVDETYAVAALPRPGESIIGELVARDVGGKGANVATVLARAGVATTLVAALGNDERGAFVRDRLGREPIATSLATTREHPTDVSLVCSTPDGDNAIVTTVAATRALEPARAIAVLDTMEAGGIVVLQGNLDRDVSLALIDAARRRELVVALNPSPLVPWLGEAIERVQIVFANEAEAETLSGERGDAAIRALLARGPERVVVTRGGAGSVLGTHGVAAGGDEACRVVEVPAVPATVIDTTGAGDTFMAVALASCLRRDAALDERALHDAARAAAVTVSRHGASRAFPSADELEALRA